MLSRYLRPHRPLCPKTPTSSLLPKIPEHVPGGRQAKPGGFPRRWRCWAGRLVWHGAVVFGRGERDRGWGRGGGQLEEEQKEEERGGEGEGETW